MERRNDLSAREQLQDAVLHAPDDAPFEWLRKRLEGALTALPPYVVAAIDLPEYMVVSADAIAHDGTIALVGIAHDGTAELRLWHPRRGLGDVLDTAHTIEHVHFPHGELEPAYLRCPYAGVPHWEAVWRNENLDLDGEPSGFLATRSQMDGVTKFILVYGQKSAEKVFVVELRGEEQRSTEYQDALLLGFFQGEPVVTEREYAGKWRVRCHDWVSHWYDGIGYLGASEERGLECFARRAMSGRTELLLVTPGGERQLASSIDPNNMFATNGRLFEVVSGSGRSRLRDHTSEFDVELPTQIAVRSVVCDGKRVHVYGLLEKWGPQHDEPHYTQFDLATGKVLRNDGVAEASLRDVGGRALLIGKRTFVDESAPDPWLYPHYGHTERLTPVDCGLASWQFVDGTFYALWYEMTPLDS